MTTFRFEAMTSSGDDVADIIEAADERDAQQKLAQQGFFVTKLQTAVNSLAAQAESVRAEPAPMRKSSLTPELQQRHRRERRSVGIGFVIMGFCVFVFGAWMAWDAVAFLSSAETATGICVGQAYNSLDNDHNVPIIEFQSSGRTRRIESQGILGMRLVNGYRKGDRVTVMYPPTSPEQARVGGTIENLQFPLAFLGGGGVFMLAGVWILKSTRRLAG